MPRRSLNISSLLVGLYTLVILTVFFSVADQPLAKRGILPLPATVAAVSSTAPFALWLLLQVCLKRNLKIVSVPIQQNFAPIFFFALVAFSSLLLSIVPTAYWQERGKWIFLISYGYSASMFAFFATLIPSFRKVFPLALFSALSFLLGSIITDMIYPLSFSTEAARPSGYPGNANFSALVCVMLCASSLDYSRKRSGWIDIAYIVVTFLALVGTMSRSGMVNFAIVMMVYGFHRFVRDGIKVKQVLSLFFGLIIMTTVVVGTVGVLMATTTVFQGKTRLGELLSGSQVDDGSAGSRLGAVDDSLRLINESPIIGHGTGFSRTMRELPHNLYLMLWVNNGVLGLLTYLATLISALWIYTKRRYYRGQAFIVSALVGGLFSHNVLDQRPFLFLFGIHLALSWIEWRQRIAPRYMPTAPIMNPPTQFAPPQAQAIRENMIDGALAAKN